MLDKTATDIANEEAIGWFQGRMEFGPRALGGRSILGDPRSEKMQKNLNLKVKFRESFRPFAPSILREDLSEWFDLNVDSPYMLMVSNINKNKTIKMTEDQKNLFGIDKLNIKIRGNGTIEANQFLQTNYPNIYVCGDVTGPYQFTHSAAHQAWYASVNALFSPIKKFKVDYLILS